MLTVNHFWIFQHMPKSQKQTSCHLTTAGDEKPHWENNPAYHGNDKPTTHWGYWKKAKIRDLT